MDRRLFLKLGAGGVAMAVLPLTGCATDAPLPTIENAGGPTAVANGTRFETRPSSHSLMISTASGDKRSGKLGSALGEFNYPVGVAVLGGLAYVVDSGNHRIQIVDTDGVSIGSLGETELLYPGGITVTADGELLVADSRNGRLVAFTPEGVATRSFGEGVLSAPRGLAMQGGSVLVADPGLRQVVELDRNGTIRRQLGRDWVLPVGVATDGTYVFVVDASASEVAVLDRDGNRVESVPLERAPSFLSLADDGILYVS